MKLIGAAVLLIACNVFLAAVAASGDNRWADFLVKPSDDTLGLVKSGDGYEECEKNAMPTTRQLTELYGLIAHGNQYAFRAGLSLTHCLDGGELEDFYRGAGEFFELQPTFFLKEAKDDILKQPTQQGRYLLTMLPLDTVDDFDKQLRTIRHRIHLLKAITSDSLRAQNIAAQKILTQSERDLEKTMSQSSHSD